ncbi:TniQ family protein [Caldifermentibacillus hisashii]|uniref:TniQ family protein n=1 Tax=Bacillaceae TaxID=186817 RepID=UPI002E1D6FE0|nr:TniQ family protein [Caldifermentibacillus hisashii]
MLSQIDEVKNNIIGKRSILYNIEPVGMGTPYVECLTSYITRLSYYHNISVRQMLTELIYPEFKYSIIRKERIVEQPKNINGVTSRTKEFVTSLEKLTGRNDLTLLTLLSLENIISSSSSLLHTHSYWCPLCYQDMYSNGQIIYDPLLWKFKKSLYCDKHLIPLVDECPHCKKKHKVLTSNSVPGYCPHCKEFLGDQLFYSLSKENSHTKTWIPRVLCELIGRFSDIKNMEMEIDINNNISLLIQTISSGNIQAFSKISGINENTLNGWKNNKVKPKFDLLLVLCENLEINLSQLLFFDIPLKKVIKAKNRLKNKDYISIYKNVERRKVDKEELRISLQNIIKSDEYPPPSLVEVGKRLGRHQTHIKRLFPELCNQIKNDYKNYLEIIHQKNIETVSKEVREIIFYLHSKNIFPKINQVGKLMKKPGYLINPKIIEVYEYTLNELGLHKNV